MELLEFKSREEAARAVSALFFEALAELESPSVTAAFPGGQSIVPPLKKIASDLQAIDPRIRGRLQLFMADERCVAPDSPEYNGRIIKEHLVAPAVESGFLSEKQFHPFEYRPGLADWGLAAYAELLNQYGGKLNLVVVAAGPDGHIASLFPNHPSSRELTVQPFIPVDGSPKPPPRRVSLSVHAIKQADLVIVLFFGEERRAALEMVRKRRPVTECPASLVWDVERSYVVTDLG